METISKINLDQLTKIKKLIIFELGCGSNKKVKESICIDKIDFPYINKIVDLEKGLPFFPDNSMDKIHVKSFFEHY